MSALLLSLADLIPAYWYLSFVALIPFLYKVTRASDAEAVRLGFLFGLALFGVRIADSLASSLLGAASVFLLGIGIFAGFGWTVARARRYWGFNALVVALIWVVFEVGLVWLGLARTVFPEAGLTTGFLCKAAVLFGFLAASFIIVLFNALLLAAFDAVVSLARARGQAVTEGEGIWDLLSPPGLVAQRLLLVAEGRGPPRLKVGLSNFHADTNSIPLAAGE